MIPIADRADDTLVEDMGDDADVTVYLSHEWEWVSDPLVNHPYWECSATIIGAELETGAVLTRADLVSRWGATRAANIEEESAVNAEADMLDGK